MPTYSTTLVNMRLLAWLILCVCGVAAATQSHNVTRRESGSGSQKRVVCYYTNWSVYRPGTAKFSPQNINPYLCTHLIYAFGGLTRENSLRPYDKYQDIEQGGYAKFTGLKTYNKQLKTMLAIGGWNEGSTRFSPLVADEERRSELVHNAVRFLRQNHFDGLDLDWEYPAFRDGGKPRDRENYALLVQELRAEFDRESAKTGRPRLLLTMAVPAGIEYIDKGYDIPKLNRYLDFMNILSYDYHSAFEPAVNHHSPLYPLEEDSEYNFDAQLSIDYTINHYMKLGADRDKLVLGIPTYGRSYTLYNPLATEIGSPADGPGEQGDATREKGYLAYYEICENLQSDGWKVEHPNRNAMGPYAYKGNQWVGYDDIDIVKLKSQYVSENGLGGIMFWSIDNDDFRGKCHGRPYPLIEAGKEALLASSGTSNDVVSVAPTRSHSKTRPKHPSSNSSNSSGNGSGRQGPQGGPHTQKKRPSARRHHDKTVRSTTSRTSTTSTTPAYNYPQTTPEPPTTPDPGSDFKCKDEGFFPHPRDCKKYFWCLDSGPSNLGIVAHQFTCPSGLFFNKAADSCDYARNVVCKKKSGETGSSTTKAPPITAATSRTTRIGSSTTASTTTSTTTAAPQPVAEEEDYDEDEYDEEGEEEVDAEEDPQAIKELINLIKKLGGVEQLEKQLHLQDPDQESKSGQVTSGFSRSLYDRVLSRSNARGNSAFSGVSSTTPRYTSLYRNRPVKPQNEGLEGLDEVKALRREKPQYVTIKRDRPATPEPEDLEDEEEEDEGEDVLLPADERQGGEDAKSQSNPIEYVTIRRPRPLSSADADTTTPRYITIQRSKKPISEPEVDDSARDADVQDLTTEMRPVYTSTTERQPETRVQIVTPIRTVATEKPAGYRKVSRNGGLESTTSEPDLKVSPRGFRYKPSESVIGIYPQYVDVTSIGRRRHSTTPQTELYTSPVSPLQEPFPHIEVNSITRRRNINHNNDLRDTPLSSLASQQLTEPSAARPQLQDVYVTSAGRRRGTTSPSTAIPEDSIIKTTTISADRYHSKYTDISMRRGSTVSDYSDISTTEKLETDNQKYEDSNTIYRKRDGTLRTADIQFNGNQSPEIDIDSNVQTTPPPPTTTPKTLREATPQVPSIPDTIPPSTTTRLTPTLTRVVTSVTESGTTERQIIAVNRVPYIAIAALRGQTVYPGPLVYNRHPIAPTDETILHRTTATTIPIQPESTTKGSVEERTISLTIQSEPKLEKVMEVNRITLVTLKQEMSLGSTRAMPGNETTERMLAEGKSDKASQVSRMKHVTVVGGSLAVSPTANYMTDMSREVFATFSTPLVSLEETTHLENTIDVQDEIPSVNSYNPSTTSSSSLDSFSTVTPSVTEQILSSVTSKQTDSVAGTVDETSSVSPLSNRRRQSSGRKPGIDDFKRRRTRPTFSTKSAEPVVSSTPSTISQKRRGQRKRPPYRPTSTTVADEEARVLTDPDESSAKYGAVNTNQNNGHRRTFTPKRGQRKRPRPHLPISTSTNADELINPLENTGDENVVLVSESIANTTVGFIPKRGNRRRGKTQKPTTETSNPTTSATTQRDVNGTLSTDVKELKDADKLFSVVSTDRNLPDSSDSIKSSTQGVDTFSSEPKSVFVPKENHRHTSNSTESDLKSELSDHIKVSTIRHSQSTESFPLHNTSPYSELHSHLTSDLNSTENATEERDPQAKEMTFRPSSTHAYTESVTPSSTKSSSSASDKSDRVRIKKRRRRPPSAQNGNTLEESTRERKVFPGNQVHNDIKVSDLTAGRNFSSITPEENSVTPFATAALLGRENYEIRTPSSIGEFVTTVDREGKNVVKISVLNDLNGTAAPLKTQKSKSVSNRDNSDDKILIAHNLSNNYEVTSYDSELTTVENSDLNADGSGYATENKGKNSVYPLPDSLRPPSEDYDSFLTSSVDFPTAGRSEGISRTNSSNASTSQNPKNYFITSVDFTADPADEQTLGSTAAIDRNKQGSANPEGKTRRLGRRKRPSSTTEGPQVQSEVVTTTPRNFRRPTGALYNPNRVRQRSTTSTTTTTTTETPASSTESEQQRRKPGARLVRRRKYGSSTNRTGDSDATASEVQPSDAANNAATDKGGSGGRVRKFSFPRRRTTTTAPPVTRPVAVTTSPTSGAPEETQSDIQLTEAETEEELTTTKLPDLANSAVVAIHNLATVPPTTQSTPEVVKSTRTSLTTASSPSTTSTTFATARLFPRRGSTVFASEEPPPSSSPSPRRLPGSVSLKPRPFSKTTAVPVFEADTRARTPKPRPLPVIDYEYYDDEDGILDVAPISGKVKIHSDGYIECLDRGNFPHPYSCKKFISCAKMENGELLGWEYTCPRQLSFDPIGGICNWSAGLGCKE